MTINHNDIENILRMLAETPERILASSQDLSEEVLTVRPDPSSWSPNEVLIHLRACVDVWEKEIDAMLTQETPTLRYISPRTWIRKTDYPKLLFGHSFEIFGKQRKALLMKLKILDLGDWSRGAIIKERKQTVYSHSLRMANHESDHCDQIEAILNNKE